MNLFSLIIHRSWEKQSLIFEDFLKKKSQLKKLKIKNQIII